MCLVKVWNDYVWALFCLSLPSGNAVLMVWIMLDPVADTAARSEVSPWSIQPPKARILFRPLSVSFILFFTLIALSLLSLWLRIPVSVSPHLLLCNAIPVSFWVIENTCGGFPAMVLFIHCTPSPNSPCNAVVSGYDGGRSRTIDLAALSHPLRLPNPQPGLAGSTEEAWCV